MTLSNPLSTSAADLLADLDPALARLPDAADHAVRQGRVLHDARWAPGESCRLAYRIPQAAQSVESFVAVHVDCTGWRWHDYWDDPALTGLRDASNPTRAATRIGSLLDTGVARCEVRPVRYRPGSRCVLRYDVDAFAGASTWYAKVFRPDRVDELAARHSHVRSAAGRPGLVADVSAVWPEVGAVVVREVAGRPLSGVLGDAGVPAEQRLTLAGALGGMLAEFHHLSGVQAPRNTAVDQVRTLHGLATTLRCADRALAKHYSVIVDALNDNAPTGEPTVLAHGGFRPGQASLGKDGELTLLDLDGVCRSAASRDLATGMAHLSWQAITQPDSRHVLQAAGDCLVDGYQRRAGRLDPQALAWWRAAALLQVAARRYRRLEVSDWDRVPVLLEEAERLLAQTNPARRPAPPETTLDLPDLRQWAAPLRASSRQGGDGAQRPVVVSAKVLATAPGRRTVVQYAVRGLHGDRIELLIGKHFTDPERAELLYRHLHDLRDGLPRPHRVPSPVALLAEGHLVLYHAAPGVPLDSIGARAIGTAGVRAAARWLASMHQSTVRLSRHLEVRREAVSARQWAVAVAESQPALADSVAELASGWVQPAESSVRHSGAVALHKDFHPGHVLLSDGAVWAIDLDEARHGPAVFDLAHFCTYLSAEGDPGGRRRAAFLREYADAMGQPRVIDSQDGSFAAWSAYTWLKIAKQRALSSGPWRGGSGDNQHTVADAVAQGLACLAR